MYNFKTDAEQLILNTPLWQILPEINRWGFILQKQAMKVVLVVS